MFATSKTVKLSSSLLNSVPMSLSFCCFDPPSMMSVYQVDFMKSSVFLAQNKRCNVLKFSSTFLLSCPFSRFYYVLLFHLWAFSGSEDV